MSLWLVTVERTYPDGSHEKYLVVTLSHTETGARRTATKEIGGGFFVARSIDAVAIDPYKTGVILTAVRKNVSVVRKEANSDY